MRHLLAHMHDDCPKWPFARGKGGYGHIQHDGRVKDVHRLVCEMTHGPAPSPAHDAAHSCGKGREGCFGAGCISWKTKGENQADRIAHGTHDQGERQYAAKLAVAQVLEIRASEGSEPPRATAKRFGVSRATIRDIQRRRRWAWLAS
jgi:hypothetical protein